MQFRTPTAKAESTKEHFASLQTSEAVTDAQRRAAASHVKRLEYLCLPAIA
jgi:hypothetical protein